MQIQRGITAILKIKINFFLKNNKFTDAQPTAVISISFLFLMISIIE